MPDQGVRPLDNVVVCRLFSIGPGKRSVRDNRKSYIAIAIWGGLASQIFGIFLGPLYSAPALPGYVGWGFWFVFLFIAPGVVVFGGVLARYRPKVGPLLVIGGGMGSLVGYGLSPAAIFGLTFLYSGVQLLRTAK